ncbi:MAG: hypothetical protein K6C94_06430 [Candidatus Gastranaerophilales bacterium]|nr:hypothetical protein [Candidatus Gastranaerophilales bacterium]
MECKDFEPSKSKTASVCTEKDCHVAIKITTLAINGVTGKAHRKPPLAKNIHWMFFAAAE